ncbi:MAG: dual specificity protein phosphatase family protein [Anaerolinea sp.]|nr:dual specificity protein phosphatase family protein [Anaerolinea sp.]MCC6974312.1 dual specificity protein phosphatase family protein [Anaerolineae bacterium]
MWRKLLKAPHVFKRRVQKQGLSGALLWASVRSVDVFTGIPLLPFSRISPQIYVGPQFGKFGKWLLERKGITACVNLRAEFDDAVHNLKLGDYCYLPTVDDEAPAPDALERGVKFIQQTVDSGGKVYIHCAGGVGRAPTMCAAYLIHQGLNFDQALNLIRKSRPFIQPSPAQLECLKYLPKRSVEK